MILAMNGRDKEASEIVNATMPPTMAQNILPYLTQMDRLNPAQQAAAAHFGRFPNGQLGPKRKPVQVAAATPAPAPPPAAVATPKRPTASERRQAAASRAPAPAPVAVSRKPDAAVSAARHADPGTARPPRRPTVPLRPATTPSTARAPAGTLVQSAPARLEHRLRRLHLRRRRPRRSGRRSTTARARSAPAFRSPTSGRTDPRHRLRLPRYRQRPLRSRHCLRPPSQARLLPPCKTRRLPHQRPHPLLAAPLASLADIVGSIEIPAEELSRPDNAIGADTLARLLDDKRKAEAAEDAKREKEAAAAKVKAEADAKAKAEAAEKKANPARIWVQVATGANAKALATDFGKFAKKSPALFKGKAGATTEWGKTRRLLVGPFKDRKAAQDWLTDYKKGRRRRFPLQQRGGPVRRSGQVSVRDCASRPEASRGRRFEELGRAVRGPRDDFQRDRDRIIHSIAFRRLRHKTQVFVAPDGDHYRVRLTHSIEVAQIGRGIARALGLNEDLTEALCLAHDIGHPPFGHAGEDALKAAMADHGGFDHNGHTLRTLARLECPYPLFDGLNLTWETLEGLAKHNGPVTDPGWALAEIDADFGLDLGSHASLEAQIAAVADDIAYDNHDIDDGLRAGLLGLDQLMEQPFVAANFRAVEERFPARRATGCCANSSATRSG